MSEGKCTQFSCLLINLCNLWIVLPYETEEVRIVTYHLLNALRANLLQIEFLTTGGLALDELSLMIWVAIATHSSQM